MKRTNSYDLIHSALVYKQAERARPDRWELVRDSEAGFSNPLWIIDERIAVLTAVNTIRAANQKQPISYQTLYDKAERLAVGHSDFTTKYARYAAELADSP